jgi:hypothetical protein
MQQFREKFLLLSDYLHDVFGAASGDGATIRRRLREPVYFSFFRRECPQMDTERAVASDASRVLGKSLWVRERLNFREGWRLC